VLPGNHRAMGHRVEKLEQRRVLKHRQFCDYRSSKIK
jgi:hypothetical protein